MFGKSSACFSVEGIASRKFGQIVQMSKLFAFLLRRFLLRCTLSFFFLACDGRKFFASLRWPKATIELVIDCFMTRYIYTTCTIMPLSSSTRSKSRENVKGKNLTCFSHSFLTSSRSSFQPKHALHSKTCIFGQN